VSSPLGASPPEEAAPAPGVWRRPLASPAVRGRDLAPLAVLVAAVTLLFRNLLRGEVFYYRDLHLQWVVQVEAFVRSIAAGSWPVWNPYVSWGQPLLAYANSQVFYPPTWLNLVMQPWSYYTLYVPAHFLLSGWGLYLLCSRLGTSRSAATLGALTWIAGGPFVSLVSLWNHLGGAAWIPWSAWAADRALARLRPGDALVWGATIALPVLAGSPEMALAAVAASMVALRQVRRPGLASQARLVAAAAAFAIGIAAVQWLPALDLLRQSSRTTARTGGEYWSVAPLGLLQCLLPPRLDALPLRDQVRAALFESREPYLPSLYLGLPALGLGLAAMASGRRLARVLSLMAVTGIALALGRHLPFLEVAQVVLPPLRALRFPAKAMLLTAFAWSVLVALGFDRWMRQDAPEDRGQRFARIAVSVIAAIAAGAAVLARFGAGQWGALLVAAEYTRRPFAAVLAPAAAELSVAAALGLALVLVVTVRGLRVEQRAAIAIAIVATDLLVAHRHVIPTGPRELYTERPLALPYAAPPDRMRVYSYDYFEDGVSERHLGHSGYRTKYRFLEDWPTPWTGAAALRTALYPSVLGYWGLEGAYTRDALGLFPGHLAVITWFLGVREGTPTFVRLLRMGAAARVVALHFDGLDGLKPLARVPGLFLEPTYVFEVPDPLGRTYAVGGARVADTVAALRLIDDPAFDPRREVILAGGAPVPPPPDFSGTSRIVHWKPDRVTIDVDLARAGFVVLVDTFDPSWRATIDGMPAEILRANVAFRAVHAPAGRHRIEMTCRPRLLLLGAVVSAMTVAVAAAVLWAGRRRRRLGPPS
jgi:hypothetical protein